MPLVRKELVKLPPLIVNSEPKVLRKMTIKDMHYCLFAAIRRCYSPEPYSIFTEETLPWWPPELPWNADFKLFIPLIKRKIFYRHLLTTCYMFYGQQEILHLFDSKPNEPSKWCLSDDGEMYTLTSIELGMDIAKITPHEALPLIALQTKQSELVEITKFKKIPANRRKKNNNEVKSNSCDKKNTQVFQKIETLPDVSVVLSPLDVSSDCTATVEHNNRRHSVSIMGTFSPKCSSYNYTSSVESLPNNKLLCSLCQTQTFSTKDNLLEHMVQCGQQDCSELKKSKFMYQLGLVSMETSAAYDRVLQADSSRDGAIENVKNSITMDLSKLPLSSSLSQKLFSSSLLRNEDDKCAFFDSDMYKVDSAMDNNNKTKEFFPVVYRPPRSKVHCHVYSFTNAERRKRAKDLEKGSSVNNELLKLLKKCKPCTVEVKQLPAYLTRKVSQTSTTGSSVVTRSKRGVITKKIFDNSIDWISKKKANGNARTTNIGFKTKPQKSVNFKPLKSKPQNMQSKVSTFKLQSKNKRHQQQQQLQPAERQKALNSNSLNGISVTTENYQKLNLPEVRVVISPNSSINVMQSSTPKFRILRVKGPASLRAQGGSQRLPITAAQTDTLASAVVSQSPKTNAVPLTSRPQLNGTFYSNDSVLSSIEVNQPKKITLGKIILSKSVNYEGPKYDCILFKCHLCNRKYVFPNGTWKNIELHLNVIHTGKSYYIRQINNRPTSSINHSAVTTIEASEV